MQAIQKILKVLGIVCVVLVALGLLVSVALTIYVNHGAGRLLNREVTAKCVVYNPFVTSLRIVDAHVSETDHVTPFADLGNVYVRLNPFSLMGKHVNIGSIALDDFTIRIVDRDTCFNFSDLTTLFADDDAKTDTTASAWKVSVRNIALNSGAMEYSELRKGRNWRLENINLNIPGLYFDNRETRAGLSLELPQGGGALHLSGDYNAASKYFALKAKIAQVDVNRFVPLIRDYLNIRSLDAMLQGELSVHGNLDDPSTMRVGANVNVEELDMRDRHRHSVLQLSRLKLEASMAPNDMQLHVTTLAVDSLNLNFIREADTNTLSELLDVKRDTTTQQKDTIGAMTIDGNTLSVSPNVIFDNLTISGSQLHYTDLTLRSDFSYTLSDMQVRAKNLSLKGNNNHVIVTAKLPDGGSLMANWRGALSTKESAARVVAVLKNVKLRDLSPWTETMFAYPIEEGTMSVSSDNSLTAGMLDAVEIVDIHGLRLGKKRKFTDGEVKNVPLKLGVDLLRDMNDNIKLTLPISGDLSSPEFSYGKIIGRAIGNVLLKATAAPFVAMANARQIPADDLTRLSVDPLQPDFDLAQYEKLDVIAQMMQDKQELQLKLTQQFGLQDAVRQRAVFDLKRDFYSQSQPDKIGRLTLVDIEKIRAIKDGNADFQAYVKQTVGTKGQLVQRALNYYGEDKIKDEVIEAAKHRNEFVMRYLTEQKNIDADRIEILTLTEDELANFKDKPCYAVEAIVKE